MAWIVLTLSMPGSAAAQQPLPFQLDNPGTGTATIDGPWQFHLGDDPAWAAATLDDSAWETLSPARPWGEQGHAGYTGFAWYRRHIHLSHGSTTTNSGVAQPGLAMMVRHIDDVYAIYWNGQLIGDNGTFPPDAAWYAQSQPPQTFGWQPAEDGVLAIRVWKAPLLSEDSGLRGGLNAPLLVGTPAAVRAAKAELDYEWLRGRQFLFGEDLLYAMVALLSLMAWLRHRQQWPLLCMALFAGSMTCRSLVFGLGIPWPMAWADAVASVLSSVRDISLWFLLLALLQLRHRPAVLYVTKALAVANLAATSLDGIVTILGWTSPWVREMQVADAVLTGIYILTVAWPLVLVGFAFTQQDRQNAASRIVAVLAFLSGMLQVVRNIAPQGSRYMHWQLADQIDKPLFTVNGNAISLVPLTGMLLLAAIVYAIYRRAQELRNHQIRLEQDLRSAQELQRVIIPETSPELAGYTLESAYWPAEEVGGDFFQIIPLEGVRAGSTLLVLGDVSGKGLKAAMTVALIVGVVRTLAETTSSPAEMLAGIGRRIWGRMQGGLVTCLVLRLDPDGASVIASAGHPPPFLNSAEMELSGTLPLGIVPDCAYDETAFLLQPNDQITLYTDGLLEARDPEGGLFGFKRMHHLLAGRPNAQAAAQAALEFGQEDDITVLTLIRG